MYPTISDLIKDLTGIYIPLPVQSFGFMMVIAFLLAAWTLTMELGRKEKQGLLKPVSKKVLTGEPASIAELVTNAIIGFILGFKVIEMIMHYRDLVDNPQEFILSARGNLIGGIAVSALLVFMKYRDKEKQRLPKPEEKMILISPHQMVGDITIIAAIFGLLGAKLFDNLEHLDAFFEDPVGALFSFSGLAFYGGLILGSAAVLWYAHKNKIPLVHMADSASPGLILAYGIGRIGCQLAGDGDWGITNLHPKPSWWFLPDWTWAFRYPHNVIQEGIQIPGCVGKFCYQLAEPVYPTPLYETTMAILIFFFLWSIRKKINAAGMIFSIYLLLNGIERIFIEIIRVDLRYHFFGITATQAQIIAAGMIVAGVTGIILSGRRRSIPTTE